MKEKFVYSAVQLHIVVPYVLELFVGLCVGGSK